MSFNVETTYTLTTCFDKGIKVRVDGVGVHISTDTTKDGYTPEIGLAFDDFHRLFDSIKKDIPEKSVPRKDSNAYGG